jgi:uracil-DNA glycosylase
MKSLLDNIQRCEVCKDSLPLGSRPVVQLDVNSKIILIGQAPGRRVHETGIPWNDASGRKLREWMEVDEAVFYDPQIFSIMSMSFCYPGKGISGDLPPRPECAPLWHSKILKNYRSTPLILLIGQYAQLHYLKEARRSNLTGTVRNFKENLPEFFPLPHPSPRNQYWIKANPWFMKEVIPELRERIKVAIAS